MPAKQGVAAPTRTCTPCRAVRQYAMNLALALDRLANALALGDPSETVSVRVARAREAGHAWAGLACRALAACGRLLGEAEDHCTWSLAPGTTGREVWSWSPPTDGQASPPA